MSKEIKKLKDLLVFMFNSGYEQGYHDTVEGVFAPIHYSDIKTCHGDIVDEILSEYENNPITLIANQQAALDALRQFSTHRHNCGLSKALNHPSYTGKCNCGLTKALAKADGGDV